jgi:hypothetical protein
MIHISPWATIMSLMAGARRLLSAGGVLYLYGRRGSTGIIPLRATKTSMLGCSNKRSVGRPRPRRRGEIGQTLRVISK